MSQTLIVALIVAAAAFYVGRKVWRTVAAARAPKSASGTGCDNCGH